MKKALFFALIFSALYSHAFEPADHVYIKSIQEFKKILNISESGKVSMFSDRGRIYDISDLEPVVTRFSYGDTEYSIADLVYINSIQEFKKILYISESGKVSMFSDAGRIYDISELEQTAN